MTSSGQLVRQNLEQNPSTDWISAEHILGVRPVLPVQRCTGQACRVADGTGEQTHFPWAAHLKESETRPGRSAKGTFHLGREAKRQEEVASGGHL